MHLDCSYCVLLAIGKPYSLGNGTSGGFTGHIVLKVEYPDSRLINLSSGVWVTNRTSLASSRNMYTYTVVPSRAYIKYA